METNIRCISLMTHPCRVPLHSISRKIINRAKSLAAELAGGLAAGSQVVLQERVCACMCMNVYPCMCYIAQRDEKLRQIQ